MTAQEPIRPHWQWVFLDESGDRLEHSLSPVFTTQFDAEEWLGGRWRRLAATGAAIAHLMHDGVPATAPLPLHVP